MAHSNFSLGPVITDGDNEAQFTVTSKNLGGDDYALQTTSPDANAALVVIQNNQLLIIEKLDLINSTLVGGINVSL